MRKKYISGILMMLLLCSLLLSCKAEPYADLIKILDSSSRVYSRQKISPSTSSAHKGGEIIALFTSENYKFFVVDANGGYNGAVRIIALLKDNRLLSMQGVDIKETDGKGTKAFEKPYIDQFINRDLSTKLLTYTTKPTDNDVIMLVSGATKTSLAILNGINTIAFYVQNS